MGQVDLNQHRQFAAIQFEAITIKPLCQCSRVERMNDVKQFDRAACLVRLQMSDQMPARLITTHLRDLLFGFLQAVPAKVCQARYQSFANPFRRMSFAYGHQADFFGLAISTSACATRWRLLSLVLIASRKKSAWWP